MKQEKFQKLHLRQRIVFNGLSRIDKGVFLSVSSIEHNTLVKYFLDYFHRKTVEKYYGLNYISAS